ncbi:MAG: hypothetical protein ACN6PP_04685 [Delftia tsuruhatensis]
MSQDMTGEDRFLDMEKDGDEHGITIEYDSDRDDTTITRDGEVILRAGGDRYDEYVDQYTRDGWKPSMGS